MRESELVFGTYPRIWTFLGPDLPKETLGEKAKVSQKGRKLMVSDLVRLKLRWQKSIREQLPPTEAMHQDANGIV